VFEKCDAAHAGGIDSHRGIRAPTLATAAPVMKLIVQIPCYNERETLPLTLAAIPRRIEGIDEVEILVIDDGSTDGTAEVARRLGVEHIVRHKVNRGLAKTFKHGIDTCLRLGADIIVNTDGDNQYGGEQIPRLLEPILEGEADVVIGDRQAAKNPHFSPVKKVLQRLGSFVVGHLSRTHVPDAVSGFRAMTRAAALQTNIVSPFSYTIEMLIQAGQRRLAVVSVPIDTNAPTRPSRLFRSIPHFIRNSLTTIVRIYTMYHPLRMFFYLGSVFTLIGAAPILRFMYFYAIGEGSGHVQSLVIGGAFLVMGFAAFLVSLIADIINFNRQLIEEILQRVISMELQLDAPKDRAETDVSAGQADDERKPNLRRAADG
jgi:glycosyltransferase involved in cell wall biosynthesis